MGMIMLFVGLVTIAVAAVWSGRAWGTLSGVLIGVALLVALLVLPFAAWWLWLAAMGVGATAQKALFAQIADEY